MPERIVVFRALQLGDLLCAVPALRALRHHAPRARITLVGLPWARELARRLAACVDDFLEFPGVCGMPERTPDYAAFPRFIDTVRARRFDLAIQMHGDGTLTNLIVDDFGAPRVIGHHPHAQYARPGFRRWDTLAHEVLRWIDLLAATGVTPRGTALEFPLEAADHAALALLLAARGIAGPIACVHPGSQLPSRRWSPASFAAVADALTALDFTVVLTGTAGERTLTAAVRAAMRTPAHDLAGETSLGTLAALIAKARLLVANDTGVSHLAAAFGTPSVIVSSGGDARRWAPLARERHRVLYRDLPCRPCAHADCPLPGHPCAAGITSAMVMHALRPLVRDAVHVS